MVLLPAAALALVYLAWSPPSADLAAQAFRTELFEERGFEVWSNAWYAGVHLPSYSLLFPPLADLLGPRLVGALAVLAGTVLFRALVAPHAGGRPGAPLAVALFGVGLAANLFTGRLTFALGLALGLAALLAFDRGRLPGAALLAALTALASPVAGLFAAFTGGVAFLAGRRGALMSLALPALAVIGAFSLLFPTGGVEPFEANTFVLIALATAILLVLVPRDDPVIRRGAWLYLALCLALFAVATPVGGNATRLGALAAAPLLVLGAAGRRPHLLVAAALLPLLYWQWVAPVRDLSDAVGEPSVERHYYEPLLRELERRAPGTPARVHVPPTRNRWEAAYVAGRHPLARGWLRQAESDDFELFRHGNLTPGDYRRWLDERAVAFVAISDGAAPDYLARDEIRLIASGLPYLHRVWRNADWRLYRVADPAPVAAPPAVVTRLGAGGFELAGPPGRYRLRLRYTPWWRIEAGAGCVAAEGDWTVVRLAEPPLAVEAELSLAGLGRSVIGPGEECSA